MKKIFLSALLTACCLLGIASPGAAMPRLPIGASVVVVELGFAGENDADQMIGLTRRKMASRAVEDINLRIMQQAGQRLALKDLPDDSSFYEHAEDERALAGGVKARPCTSGKQLVRTMSSTAASLVLGSMTPPWSHCSTMRKHARLRSRSRCA